MATNPNLDEHLALAEREIKIGSPNAALKALTAAVKSNPNHVKARIFLAQLLCILGQWERAHTQLNVVAQLDESTGPMREMVGHALRCEKIRAGVFDGRRSPMIFGEPEEWLARLIESLLQSGRGAREAARQLATSALEAAPASSGKVNDVPFEWIADGDSRLGPVLEASVNGRYYWVPFSRLARIDIEAPADLRDLVWIPAQLQFRNGGEAIALIPTRYPGSEKSPDDRTLMARQTVWHEDGPDRWTGEGQRVLVTDQGDHDLLAIRTIEFADDA